MKAQAVTAMNVVLASKKLTIKQHRILNEF
jgi:hypothetical protein